MKKILTAVAALSLVSTSAFAGGLNTVVVEEEPAAVVVTETGSSGSLGSGGVILPVALGLALLCAAACGSDS